MPARRSDPRPGPGRAGWPVASLIAGILLAGCIGSGTAVPSGSAGASAAVSVVPGAPSPLDTGPPLAVLGTEDFYADLLAQIGGHRVHATSLLNDPNADPHTYESDPRAAAAVADARLVVVNGLGYDSFMDRLLAASPDPDRVVVDVQALLGRPDGVNVHVWYDPATMPRVAAAATEALARLDPPNRGYFAARERAYLSALQPVAAKIAELRAKHTGAPIAFTEDVAGYLTGAIGLELTSPTGFMKAVEDGTDPAPADVAKERDLLTSKAVRVLVFNSQVTSPTTDAIRELATQNGIPVVGVAETMPPEYSTYQAWQLAELAELERALATGS